MLASLSLALIPLLTIGCGGGSGNDGGADDLSANHADLAGDLAGATVHDLAAPANADLMTNCQSASLNGDETDVGCGGSVCPSCVNGKHCTVGGDCMSGFCTNGLCAMNHCIDGVTDGDETDIDCGGFSCPQCAVGKMCKMGGDCLTGNCGANNTCVLAANCMDGIKNQDETDIDCGGEVCMGCPDGKHCMLGLDCKDGNCVDNVCVAMHCLNNTQDADETDVDCGGTACAPCATAKKCAANTDCQSLDCKSNTCAAATCTDGIKNQGESDVDCGGTQCAGCKKGGACVVDGDCASQTCTKGVCM